MSVPVLDALSPEGRELPFAEWWPVAESRLERLATRDGELWDQRPTRRNHAQRDLLREERRYLLDAALPQLVGVYVEKWREENSAPFWRLPPDGWVFKQLTERLPALRETDRDLLCDREWERIFSEEQYGRPLPHSKIELIVAYLEREYQDAQHAIPWPFLQSVDRRPFRPVGLSLLEDQEQKNLEAMAPLAKIIAEQKRSTTGAVADVFASAGIDSSMPDSVVVYHQTGRRRIRTRIDQVFDRFFAAHLELVPGDVVRYDHSRSATAKARWFNSLENPKQGATLKVLNDPVAPEDENGLRLELVPLRGVYIGTAAQQVLGISGSMHSEMEVILPAGTVWEVVGIVDAIYIQDDDLDPTASRTLSAASRSRLRAVQMREIEKYEIAGRPVRSMTEPIGDFDRYLEPEDEVANPS